MSAPRFGTLDDVRYGVVEQVSPLVRRVIAENPSKYTYRGTGTYIVGHGEVAVIDPGPVLDSHRDALREALRDERVVGIAVTHCHIDHSPLATWVHEETGAPRYAFGPHPRPTEDDEYSFGIGLSDEAEDRIASFSGEDPARHGGRSSAFAGRISEEDSIEYDFAPDVVVADGERAASGPGWTLRGVYTPGHTSNHLCFALDEEATLFTGDHVMGWSTTVVSPPDGDMRAYLDSLRKVAGRGDAVLRPTHGAEVADPATYVGALIEHRCAREEAILALVRDGVGEIPLIVAVLYADVREELHKPAGRSVLAHLVKLVDDGSVAVDGDGRPTLEALYRAV